MLASEDVVSASRMAVHQDLKSVIMGAWLEARFHTDFISFIVRKFAKNVISA